MTSLSDQYSKIKYLHLYLAETTIKADASLNLMFAVKNNNDTACELPLRVYVCPSELVSKNGWRLGEQKNFRLEAKKIQHIYMNIPSAAFAKSNWDSVDYDEFLISCSNSAPTNDSSLKNTTDIVFIIH